MARTDDDTWELASSVGATATMVATARAVPWCDWRMTGNSIHEPFAAHGLAPFDDEELAGFGDVRYVWGLLGGDR